MPSTATPATVRLTSRLTRLRTMPDWFMNRTVSVAAGAMLAVQLEPSEKLFELNPSQVRSTPSAMDEVTAVAAAANRMAFRLIRMFRFSCASARTCARDDVIGDLRG